VWPSEVSEAQCGLIEVLKRGELQEAHAKGVNAHLWGEGDYVLNVAKRGQCKSPLTDEQNGIMRVC